MSLLSATRTMALGTVASRATGFLRTAVLAAVLGVKGVALAFNIANTAPNIVYELLLGGILTSVVVPLLVRANKEGQGEAYVQRSCCSHRRSSTSTRTPRSARPTATWR
jgi:putative peptidoglycan lipid II flippase